MIDRQDIFNRAYTGLKSQGFLASESRDIPAYRGDHGRRCVIGWLIPDKYYTEELEEEGVLDVNVLMAAGFQPGRVTYADCSFLERLQNVHDFSADPENMEALLIAFADDNELTIPSDDDEVSP